MLCLHVSLPHNSRRRSSNGTAVHHLCRQVCRSSQAKVEEVVGHPSALVYVCLVHLPPPRRVRHMPSIVLASSVAGHHPANSSRLIDLIGRIDSPKRFSSFLDLLTRLAKEVGKTAGHAVIDTWKRQLTIEKRHTGKASRTEQVVNGRIQLLQRLLDELTAVRSSRTRMLWPRSWRRLQRDGRGKRAAAALYMRV